MIPTKEEVDKYIKDLKFKHSNEHEKTLVIGNLNTFYDWILKESIEWERTGNILETTPSLTEIVNGVDTNNVHYEGTAIVSSGEIIEVEYIEPITTVVSSNNHLTQSCPYRLQDACHFKGTCTDQSCSIRASNPN